MHLRSGAVSTAPDEVALRLRVLPSLLLQRRLCRRQNALLGRYLPSLLQQLRARLRLAVRQLCQRQVPPALGHHWLLHTALGESSLSRCAILSMEVVLLRDFCGRL